MSYQLCVAFGDARHATSVEDKHVDNVMANIQQNNSIRENPEWFLRPVVPFVPVCALELTG